MMTSLNIRKSYPDAVDSGEQLEDVLSTPTDAVIETMGRVDGDIILLGVGGKMGPTLARMARRASDEAGVKRRVYGVSTFNSDRTLRSRLEAWGVRTVACDMLDADQVGALPKTPHVIYMAGMKFGATGNESLTWAVNAFMPGQICHHFRESRFVAFSTANVYGLTPVCRGGALESDPLAPVGEYAASCAGRERIFEHFSLAFGMPMVLVRLSYATELRYGVLVDMARRVYDHQPVDLTMGNLNAIWQGDANAVTLLALERTSSPPLVLNVSGPELLSVRQVCETFGRLMNRPVRFHCREAEDAIVVNCQHATRLFGYPRVSADQMIDWIADWVLRGGENMGKPTHFEVRDGKY
jgi:nucleoside-diphosphate-sugar epimerase